MDLCEFTNLEMSLEKSYMVFSTSEDNREELAKILGLPIKLLPIYHLGV